MKKFVFLGLFVLAAHAGFSKQKNQCMKSMPK